MSGNAGRVPEENPVRPKDLRECSAHQSQDGPLRDSLDLFIDVKHSYRLLADSRQRDNLEMVRCCTARATNA